MKTEIESSYKHNTEIPDIELSSSILSLAIKVLLFMVYSTLKAETNSKPGFRIQVFWSELDPVLEMRSDSDPDPFFYMRSDPYPVKHQG